ncbi:phytoene/squalene synthase family protein [Paraliomyxa miuraensis]|uniref:phytoene/squalene synthase family protein n=1 Tax=Paraliomyxa miuraensis TaxID=376150 RepID=UPI00224E2546|nr:squalene/phytoene synthase family protein [Paraliomyxa miuraensis]MCX4244458.1 squalene/phytoene synthase family protein [Paraliomyxa miuraensis]
MSAAAELRDDARPEPQRRHGRGVTGLLRRLTERSSSNFKFAFLFLGPERAEGLHLVYEFCRVVDDIVDEREPGPEGAAKARLHLHEWSREIARIYGDAYFEDDPPHTELGRGLRRTHALFEYPREAFDEIIAGVAMDLDRDRYEDLEDLRLYCYRVASCVGFLCIALFGDQTEPARRYAEHLGLALQYTNILRDVAEDAARGRIYLPRELLTRHGLRDDDVLRQRYDDRFVAMASDFADAAEREYRRAWDALRAADAKALLPAEIMGRTYHRILGEIRTRNFNVFTRRPVLRRRDKLKVAALAIARSGLTW